MNYDKSVLDNINESYERMFAVEKKVADYILNNPGRVVETNVSELAELSGASDATVIRMCKRIGYEGYSQMKIKLSHDLGKDRMIQLQSGKQNPDTINDVFQIMISNLSHMAEHLDMELILKCVQVIKSSRTIHVVASGNTIPIAMDLSFRLERLGIRAISSIIPEYYLGSIGIASSEDLVIAISHSGSSKNILQALELAKGQNIQTMVLTDSACSPAARLADFILCTCVDNPIFKDNGPVSHLYEMAMIDTLLYFIKHDENQQLDHIELLLSEYKV
ncbi:MurR/RpiR family transcriptional regulator [Oscillospiraceae bacterium PP1C4]